MCKIPSNSISRTNCIAKNQKSFKGLKFGDRQNAIDLATSVGVDRSSDHVSEREINSEEAI